MTLTHNSLKSIIIVLVATLVLAILAPTLSFLAVEQAQAQLVVSDPTQIANSWIQRALNVAKEAIMWVTEKAFHVSLANWSETVQFLKETAYKILAATAIKIAVKYLLAQVELLRQAHNIDSYLYYTDFLVRNIYTLEHVRKNYQGKERAGLIVLSLLQEGEGLYNRLSPGTKAYEGIKQATLSEKCQTHNLSPQHPEYYLRLMESRSTDCIPQFVAASYRDAALTALGQAQQAAQQEIAAGGGYKAGRQCGTVATKDLFKTETVFTQTKDANTGVVGSQLQSINQVKVGEAVDVVPTISSVVCSVMTYSAGQASVLINQMVDRILSLEFDKSKNATNSAQLRNLISDTLSTVIPRLLESKADVDLPFFDSQGNLRLAQRDLDRNYNNLLNEIPAGINAGDLGTAPTDGNFGSSSGRDERRLGEYWRDMCEERMPLLFAYKNGNYPGNAPNTPANGVDAYGDIHALNAGELQKGGISFFTGPGSVGGRSHEAAKGSTYLPARTHLRRLFGVTPNSEPLSIEKMLTVPFTGVNFVPENFSDDRDNHANGEYVQGRDPNRNADSWQTNPVKKAYYIWQNHDGGHDSIGNGFDDELALGKKYWMSRYGFPAAEDIKGSTEWIPLVWPFWLDSQGFGYVWPTLGIGSNTENYTDRGDGKLYRATPGGVTELVATVRTSRVYETSSQELILAWSDESSSLVEAVGATSATIIAGTLYKLNKNVSVVINNGVVQTNPNSFRSSGGEAFFVEYTDAAGAKKVLSAEKINRQAPCKQQPYGPPTNLLDIKPKLDYTEKISKPLWDWIMEGIFIQENRSQ